MPEICKFPELVKNHSSFHFFNPLLSEDPGAPRIDGDPPAGKTGLPGPGAETCRPGLAKSRRRQPARAGGFEPTARIRIEPTAFF